MLLPLWFSALLLAADPACAVKAIIAHRGSSADRPENTLAAYRRAIEAGASAIEVDLRLTRDGHLVSLHDAKVDRTTGAQGPVDTFTLAQLSALDAGAWLHERYRGERIPTFPQILALTRGRSDVLLDLKGEGEPYLNRIRDDIRRHGEPGRIIAGVRSLEHAAYFRRQLPEARQIGLIPTANDIESFVQAGVKVIRLWPRWLADTTLPARVDRAGAEFLVAADDGSLEELERLLPFGPTYLFTNHPRRLMQSLRQRCPTRP
jgi:glycerophosphoryl diester phosphodiesterase